MGIPFSPQLSILVLMSINQPAKSTNLEAADMNRQAMKVIHQVPVNVDEDKGKDSEEHKGGVESGAATLAHTVVENQIESLLDKSINYCAHTNNMQVNEPKDGANADGQIAMEADNDRKNRDNKTDQAASILVKLKVFSQQL